MHHVLLVSARQHRGTMVRSSQLQRRSSSRRSQMTSTTGGFLLPNNHFPSDHFARPAMCDGIQGGRHHLNSYVAAGFINLWAIARHMGQTVRLIGPEPTSVRMLRGLAQVDFHEGTAEQQKNQEACCATPTKRPRSTEMPRGRLACASGSADQRTTLALLYMAIWHIDSVLI